MFVINCGMTDRADMIFFGWFYRQVLAIANTATSTFTSLLQMEGTSIPAFQTFFNYVLLNLIFTPYTIYRYGFKGWLRLLIMQGWKCKFECNW